MPGVTSARRMTSSASPVRSRTSSVEKLSLTIGATARPTFGNSSGFCSARQAAAARIKRTTDALLNILDFHLFAGNALRQRCRHELVQVAVKNVGWGGRGYAGPKVLHQLIGLQDIGADLMAPADVSLGRVCSVGFSLPLLQLGLIEPGLQLL